MAATAREQPAPRIEERTGAEEAKQRLVAALGELAGQFTVQARPCHFERSPLAGATVVATIRAAGPGTNLNAAHRAVASLPGVFYATINGSEVWIYMAPA